MGFFAAFCGSILAAITAVGTIMMPKMIEAGYPKPFVIVLAASAALLEALIPPSNAAILYSALTYVLSRRHLQQVSYLAIIYDNSCLIQMSQRTKIYLQQIMKNLYWV